MPDKKRIQSEWNDYYHSILFQFLGLEKDIYINRNGSYTIYHNRAKLNIFPKANKIYFPRERRWLKDADMWLRKNVIRDKSCPTINGELF